jgi:predicted ArsR family transcriptional regulator
MAKIKFAAKKTTRKPAGTKTATPIMREGTKQKLIVDLLNRPDGATIAEMAEATGWQPHTVRGVLAGPLKKNLGLAVVSEKTDDRGRVYRTK